MTINEIQEEIISDLDGLEMIEKYEYLINLGKLLPQISEKNKNNINKIRGCQSRAWVLEIPQKFQSQDTILIEGILPNLKTIKNLQKLVNLSDLLPIKNPNTDEINHNFKKNSKIPKTINQNITKHQSQVNLQILDESKDNHKNKKLQNQSQFQKKELTKQESNQIFSQDFSSNFNNFSQNLERKLCFSGFSDSQIVGGLLGLLWKIFDGQNKSEILKSDLFLISRISFDELLTVRRREGFWQIYHRIIQMSKT